MLSVPPTKRPKNNVMCECRVGALCNGRRLSVHNEQFSLWFSVYLCTQCWDVVKTCCERERYGSGRTVQKTTQTKRCCLCCGVNALPPGDNHSPYAQAVWLLASLISPMETLGSITQANQTHQTHATQNRVQTVWSGLHMEVLRQDRVMRTAFDLEMINGK